MLRADAGRLPFPFEAAEDWSAFGLGGNLGLDGRVKGSTAVLRRARDFAFEKGETLLEFDRIEFLGHALVEGIEL